MGKLCHGAAVETLCLNGATLGAVPYGSVSLNCSCFILFLLHDKKEAPHFSRGFFLDVYCCEILEYQSAPRAAKRKAKKVKEKVKLRAHGS